MPNNENLYLDRINLSLLVDQLSITWAVDEELDTFALSKLLVAVVCGAFLDVFQATEGSMSPKSQKEILTGFQIMLKGELNGLPEWFAAELAKARESLH